MEIPSPAMDRGPKAIEINVTELIDQSKFGRYQFVVVALCGLIAVLDGFDLQAMAFVAPVIATEWNIPISNFTGIFAAGLVGLTVGSLVLGPVADIVGRRSVILAALVIFGVFSVLSGISASVSELVIFRFLTGFGLGGALPNLIALTSEYAPARRRASIVTAMFCGVPLGAVVGGAVSAAWLIPQFGWASVFYAGGVLPLAMLPLAWLALPESIRFLVSKGRNESAIARIINRMYPGAVPAGSRDGGGRFTVSEERLSGLPVRHLFTEGRAAGTIPMWIAFFMNLLVMHSLMSWLPSLLREAGLPIERAIIASVVLNIGGIVGGLLLAQLIDRFGPFKILAGAYAAGAATVASLGFVTGSAPLVMSAVFASGFCIIGAQFGANALAASYYPTSMRSTGVGWALGVGRIGSIVGPVFAGVMLSYQLTNRDILVVSAIPAVLAAAAILLMRFNLAGAQRKRSLGHRPAPAAGPAPAIDARLGQSTTMS